MFDIINLVRRHSWCVESISENFKKLEINCICNSKSDLTLKKVKNIINYFENSLDVINIEIECGYRIICDSDSINNYVKLNQELNELYENIDDETINLKILVKKEAKYYKNIYNIDAFVDYIVSLDRYTLLSIFSNTFNRDSFSLFKVLDKEFFLKSKYIIFQSDENELLKNESNNREKLLKNYELASSFVCSEIKTIPEDFHVLETNFKNKQLLNLFKELEMILSIAYISLSSYYDNKNLIFRIKDNVCWKLKGESFEYNSNLFKICEWSFEGDNPVEKSAISRNVVMLNCKTESDFYNLDESVLISIKSNFNIYKKSTVEKYLELKKDISQSVVDLTKEFESIFDNVTNAIKNNVIAIFTVLVSLILTDSFQINGIKEKRMPENLRLIFELFSISFLMFYIMNVIFTVKKFKRIQNCYERLKGNYKDLLDKNDFDNSFNKQDFYNSQKKENMKEIIKIYVIWAVSLIIICYFIVKHVY